MKKQLGFVLYAALGALVVIAGLSIALKVQSSRLDSVKHEYAAFQAQVKALGDVAEAKARAKEKADLEAKRRIDNENKSLRANLAAESKRLRDARASSSFLPSTGTATPSVTVTANRAKLEAALRDFDTTVARIVDEGDSAIADLNAAKSWVKDQAAVKP